MHKGNSLKGNQRKGDGNSLEDPYGVLDLRPGAATWEVEEAYRRIMAALDPSNPWVLALWTPEELERMRQKVEEAYRILTQTPDKGETQCPPRVQGLPKGAIEEIKAQKGGLGGEALREIRERLGLSLEEVSSHIKVTKGTLRALEEERFESLPPWIYVKGFLKAYARLLKVDPEEVIGTFWERYCLRNPSPGRNRQAQ